MWGNIFIYDILSLNSFHNKCFEQGFRENQNKPKETLLGDVWKYDIRSRVTDDNAKFGRLNEESQQYMCIYLKQ
jgi:hypothetical protein